MQINRAFPLPAFMTLGAMLLLSACDGAVPRAGERAPSHPPAVAPAAPLPPRAPAPGRRLPPPPPSAPAIDWRDMPLPPGDWTWSARPGGSIARFGVAGQLPTALLQCDRAEGVVRIALPYAGAYAPNAEATITTSTSSGTVAVAQQVIDGQAMLIITLPAAHHLLDAMAFSRGRFLVQIDGMSRVALPSWSEVGRVVEDCRG